MNDYLAMVSEKFNVFRIATHFFYGKILSKRSFVVDLGANQGDFANEIVSLFRCQCVAVEPLEKVRIERENAPLLQVVKWAVSDFNEVGTFYRSADPQSHSLFQVRREDIPIQVSTKKFGDWLEEEKIEVIDLLKVDIEGAEVFLFNTLSDQQLMNIKQITIEFHDFLTGLNIYGQVQAIRTRLKKLGFEEFIFDPRYLMDCLYIQKTKVNMPFVTWVYLKSLAMWFRLRKFRLRILGKL